MRRRRPFPYRLPMGLFTRKAIYDDFTLSGGKGGVPLFAHFTTAARGKRDATLPAHAILEQVRGGLLHPDDSALFMLALERMAVLIENDRFTAEFEAAAARRTAEEKRIANLLAADRYDLRAPDKPFRRHLHGKNEPPRRYKGYALLTGDHDNIRASLKLVRPEMYHVLDARAHHPRFTHDFTEHRLLYEHHNNGHLNYDDQLMVHEALLALRAYKINNNLPAISLHPAAADKPAPPPERPRHRGHGIYF